MNAQPIGVVAAELRRWVQAQGGDARLAQAAGLAAHAEAEGHACIALSEHDFDAADIAALRSSPWVSTQPASLPFVLDAAGRFYLRRNAEAEATVAQQLLARARASAPRPAQATQWLQQLLPDAASSEQRSALAQAFGRRLFVLAGGPGTGKTTALLALLLGLLRGGQAAGLPAQPRLALVAPTGKAAARMGEAVQAGHARLRSRLAGDAEWQPALASVAALQPGTLHRLLRARQAADTPHGLDLDVLAVDEASMVDLALMRHLLTALRPDATLLLLGDPDQLASVEAGSVLGDVLAAAAPASPLGACVARLTRSHRAGADLAAVLTHVRDGAAAAVRAAAVQADAALTLHASDDAAALQRVLHVWLQRHEALYLGLLDAQIAPAEALARLARAQLLCALRSGPFGAQHINGAIERWLRARRPLPAGYWFSGRVVMITHNDDQTGLRNGEIGVALGRGEALRVHFPAAGGSTRAFQPALLPPHEPAWAITIHKAQGSEYDSVAALLPADADSPILSRELVYTALSRARSHAELWSGAGVLEAALARPLRRGGALRERLLADAAPPQ